MPPSRKKTKGKARKAQAAAGGTRCTHGFVPPEKDDALWPCYDAFEEELGRLAREEPRFQKNPATGGMRAVKVVAESRCAPIWSSRTREDLKACLLVKAVDSTINIVEEKGYKRSVALIAAVMLLENWDETASVTEMMSSASFLLLTQKHRDTLQGCQRSMFRFLAKRLPCSCLDTLRSDVKKAMPKVCLFFMYSTALRSTLCPHFPNSTATF